MSQNLREKLAEMDENIKAKNEKLVTYEEDLKVSQKEKDTLACKMANIKKEMESAQRRGKELLREKNALEKDLREREAEIEGLKLKNSSITAVKEEEITNYHKQLESIRKKLEKEEKEVSSLQEELRKKSIKVAEKKRDIKHLTEARDRANSELERERELSFLSWPGLELWLTTLLLSNRLTTK